MQLQFHLIPKEHGESISKVGSGYHLKMTLGIHSNQRLHSSRSHLISLLMILLPKFLPINVCIFIHFQKLHAAALPKWGRVTTGVTAGDFQTCQHLGIRQAMTASSSTAQYY